MPTYPTTALQPGMSGAAVKQLQEYLISQGYSIPDGATGYYGPQTKAAVTKLQQDKGVDNSTGPGYWGPRTIAKLSEQPKQAAPQKQDDAKKLQELQSQAEDLQKKIDATVQYGFTDTDQVKKDSSGNYVPKSEAEKQVDVEENKQAEAINKMAFKNSAEYKALGRDLQDLVDLGVRSFMGTEADRAAFADALTKAQALADPYAKSQLALFRAEFGTKIAQTTQDYAASKEILERTRNELAEDLKNGKEFLTLEQQADMARALKGYDEDLLTIADQAAEKGITFATGARSRAIAEDRRKTEYQDVVQSGQREFNFKVRELELKAARGDADAKAKLDSLERNKGFDLTKIGQSAERILGSSGVSALGLPGYTPVGGVLGEVEQERRKSILDIASSAIPR